MGFTRDFLTLIGFLPIRKYKMKTKSYLICLTPEQRNFNKQKTKELQEIISTF